MTTDAGRLQRLRALFDAVADLAPVERTATLDRLTAGDDGLRREVEAVLRRSEERTAAALESPGIVTAGDHPAASLPVGARVGAYTIVRLVGTGGMGAVYEATRDDEHYRQRVAIKVMQGDLEGGSALARFRQERQILASLVHPNIATLHDGGVLPDGRAYLVMEFVAGAPITEWCYARALPLRERVELFRQACAAVHHAHQNLVIHRDLKPGNILVSDDGLVKLLDFGIAKALLPDNVADGDAAQPLTRAGTRAFTPEYASPEQLRGEALTTASDIYSLGVVFFELLTGRRPYQPRSRALADVERAVLDTPAPRPSSVLTEESSRSLGGQSRARARQRLHGDLDSIALAALHQEPGRRYPSAEAFGDDLRRYLDGLPVRAQRDRVGYRLRKFVRRNRVASAATALAAAALLSGTALATVSARHARAEQVKAQQSNEFLRTLLASVHPETGSRDARVSEVLDAAARRVDLQFGAQPEMRAELLTVIGESYQGLGRYDDAQRQLETALLLRQQSAGARSTSAVIGLSELGNLYLDQGSLDSAGQLFHRALDIQQSNDHHPDSLYAALLSNLGSLAHSQGHAADAERIHRQVYALRRKLFGDRSDDAAVSLNDLAVAVGDEGRLAEAETMHRAALAIVQANNPRPDDRVAAVLSDLASVLDFEGKTAAADSAYRQSLAMRKRLLGADHPDYALSLFNYAGFILDQQRYDEAIGIAHEILALRGHSLADSHPAVAGALQVLGKSLDKRGDRAGAERALKESLALRQRYLAADSWMIASAVGNLGEHYTGVHDYARAEPLLLHAQRMFVASLGEQNTRTAVNTRRLVALYSSWGKPALAATYSAKLP
jgi:serine/threonine protein kinase/Flp pilus assembly protein TadD